MSMDDAVRRQLFEQRLRCQIAERLGRVPGRRAVCSDGGGGMDLGVPPASDEADCPGVGIIVRKHPNVAPIAHRRSERCAPKGCSGVDQNSCFERESRYAFHESGASSRSSVCTS